MAFLTKKHKWPGTVIGLLLAPFKIISTCVVSTAYLSNWEHTELESSMCRFKITCFLTHSCLSIIRRKTARKCVQKHSLYRNRAVTTAFKSTSEHVSSDTLIYRITVLTGVALSKACLVTPTTHICRSSYEEQTFWTDQNEMCNTLFLMFYEYQ